MQISIYLLLAALFLQTLLTLTIMVIMGKRRFKAVREKQIQF